jgi:hypothetical protein
MPLTWNGDQVLARVRQAEEAGLNDTLKDAVDTAKEYVRVDTGNLKSKIRVVEPAQSGGDGVTGQFGVDDVEYAMDQEVGPTDGRKYGFTPYIRPSADINAKKLAGNIKKHF